MNADKASFPPWAAIAIAVIVAVTVLGLAWMYFTSSRVDSDFETKYLDPEQKVSIVVLRKVDNAFPVYAREFKAELELTKKEKDETLQRVANTAAEAKVKSLYEQLDQLNNDLRQILISSYVKYVTTLSAAHSPEER